MLLRNFIHGGGHCLLVQPQSLRLSCFLVVCCVERHLTVLWNKALERVRGTPNVDAEFEDLVEASKEAKSMENPFQNLLLKKNRPQFIIGALAIPVFQQLTGNNSILFCAQTLGFGARAALYSSVITSVALLLPTKTNQHQFYCIQQQNDL